MFRFTQEQSSGTTPVLS